MKPNGGLANAVCETRRDDRHGRSAVSTLLRAVAISCAVASALPAAYADQPGEPSSPSATALRSDASLTAPPVVPTLLPRGRSSPVPIGIRDAGVLNAWFDWNADGDFGDSGEQVVHDRAVAAGTLTLNVAVPPTATIGLTSARVRVCPDGIPGDGCNTPTNTLQPGVVDLALQVVDAPGPDGTALGRSGDPSGAMPAGSPQAVETVAAAGTSPRRVGSDAAVAPAQRGRFRPTALSADLRLTKTNTPGVNGEVDQAADTVVAGTASAYAIKVTNLGPDAADGSVIFDPAPINLTCTTASCLAAGGAACPASTGAALVAALQGAGVAIPTLPNGGVVTITLTCTVN